jgi:DNA-binding beta-propeller fold protein YncE
MHDESRADRCLRRVPTMILAALMTAPLGAAGPAAAVVAPPRPSATTSIEVKDLGEVEVQLSPASVVTDRTRFVVGRDRPHGWDRSRVRVRRGEVDGESGSRMFLVETAEGRIGYLDLDGTRHWISTRERSADPSSKRGSKRGLPPNTPLCGCGADHRLGPMPPRSGRTAAMLGVPQTTRVIELAVETDHELHQMVGGDVDDTLDYIVELYSAVSDIFERDFDARIELTFVRVWDTPEDLFNEPEPLQPFRQHWNQRMGEVERDVAQFLSGRRDLPWGGIAYLSALCGNAAYSVAGYALGFIPDLDRPSIYHYDVMVVAHEIGHNVGAYHTHSYGLDDCFNLAAPPQRGTIMSYCSQSVSGGNAVSDLRFHTYVQEQVRLYLEQIPCGHFDCDGDGVDDAEQIASGAATDANGNGVPDVCEDCDGDGILDDEEIASGAADVDGDLVPDECQADCNGNGVPDRLDIALGTSADLHANGVPDECEADCDGNGIPDYDELMADMSLDLDRNRILDACEDCDGDGEIDFAALDGALDCWIATHAADGAPRRFHAVTGTLTAIAQGSPVLDGNDVRIDRDGVVHVSSGAGDRVARFDRSGTALGDLAGAGSMLSAPTGLEIGPTDGLLYVASGGTNSVLRFDRGTGSFVDVFVEADAGGLISPFGLAFGPDGHLYVNGGDRQVRRYDGETGEFIDVFVSSLDNGGLASPRGMIFLPDGHLIVASRGTDELLEFDGTTGAPLGRFNRGGTSTALTFDEPWGVRIGPNGNVYASRHHVDPGGQGGGLFDNDIAELHVNASRIYEFDVDSGNFLRSYVTGHDTGLWSPTGFDFLPGEGLDCNGNNVPDACDIESGRSADSNGDGVPDECGVETAIEDLDQDGVVGPQDLAILLSQWATSGPADFDGDGVVGAPDLSRLLAAWNTRG